MTGNGGGFNSTRSCSRSPSPTSPLRFSTSSTEAVLPAVSKHFTGSNIAKLTQQLTGNGLTFLTASGRLASAPEGINTRWESVSLANSFSVRPKSPEPKILNTLMEEDDEEPLRQQEKDHSKPVYSHSRSRSKGKILG